ncbi:hypothetical protein BDV96DRAFT_648746 [Lophiotrema nucula]|uniref:Uncharacterized protein n=1 Tax=Lophiotrema nucula TaxID=690887 RepID=A0A6A5Z254_9PLEO|nr:hypothetical protein BDV96DRAFT_648746 [Lophiotrema nucula]
MLLLFLFVLVVTLVDFTSLVNASIKAHHTGKATCVFDRATELETRRLLTEISKELESYPFLEQNIGIDVTAYPSRYNLTVLQHSCDTYRSLLAAPIIQVENRSNDVSYLITLLDDVITHRRMTLGKLQELRDRAEAGFQSLLRNHSNVSRYEIKYEYELHPIPLLGMLRNIWSSQNSITSMQQARDELVKRRVAMTRSCSAPSRSTRREHI